jgi:hypothetical protein
MVAGSKQCNMTYLSLVEALPDQPQQSRLRVQACLCFFLKKVHTDETKCAETV